MTNFPKKTAWMTLNLDIIKANRDFLTYFETPSLHCNNFLDFVIEEEKAFLKGLIASGPSPKKFYHFKLHENSGRYKNNVLNFVVFEEKGQKLLDVTVYDVEDLLQFNSQSISEESRIRHALSTTDEHLFFYSDVTKKIQIVHYFQNQKITLYDADIEEWKKEMLSKNFISPDSISSFVAFVTDIMEIPGNVTANLVCSIRSGTEDVRESLRFVGCGFVDNSTSNSVMFNNLAASEDRSMGIGDKVKAGNFVAGRILSESYSTQETNRTSLYNDLHIDSLTHIYNKKTIQSFGTKLIAPDKTDITALIIVDLDHFKPVNDIYGHLEGDKVLEKTASVLKEITGDDGYVGRFGGDEFMMLVKGLTSEAILRGFLSAILTNIRASFEGKYGDINVTCSIGCAMFPQTGNTFEELFRKADFCLYRAKNKGRNRYVFYREDMHSEEYKESLKIKSTGGKYEVRELTELRYMSQFLTSLLQDNKTEAFATLFNHMKSTYNLDAITLYSSKNFNPVYKLGAVIPDNRRIITFLKPEYLKYYGKSNSLCINFFSNLKEDELKKEMIRHDVKSSMICILGTKEDIKGAIVFDRIENMQMFAEYEINCIEMASSILNMNDQKLFHELTQN